MSGNKRTQYGGWDHYWDYAPPPKKFDLTQWRFQRDSLGNTPQTYFQRMTLNRLATTKPMFSGFQKQVYDFLKAPPQYGPYYDENRLGPNYYWKGKTGPR